MRLAPNGDVYVIEANPNPWLASRQEFAMAAKASGLTYTETDRIDCRPGHEPLPECQPRQRGGHALAGCGETRRTADWARARVREVRKTQLRAGLGLQPCRNSRGINRSFQPLETLRSENTFPLLLGLKFLPSRAPRGAPVPNIVRYDCSAYDRSACHCSGVAGPCFNAEDNSKCVGLLRGSRLQLFERFLGAA